MNCHGSMYAGEWCKDCPEFGRKCDEMEGDMTEEISVCDSCWKEFDFNKLAIYPPYNNPRLLCPECVAAEEKRNLKKLKKASKERD